MDAQRRRSDTDRSIDPWPRTADCRWRRWLRRVTLTLTYLAAAVVLTVAGGAWAATRYVTDAVHRVRVGTAPATAGRPLTILVVGIDHPPGMTLREEIELHVGRAVSFNADEIMLAHVAGNGRSVQVVSIPRDSWVDIPGYGYHKINAAYGLGGPGLLVRTVESLTGLTVNDYIEVTSLSFVKIINALGGVNICLPAAIDDPDSGLHLSAGMHHVNGVTAFKYARDRHSYALSDLARIRNQQRLLSSALSQAIHAGLLTNPARFTALVHAVVSTVTVNRGFDVTALAERLRNLSLRDVTFTTVPLSNIDYRAPDGELAVVWNHAAATRLFDDLASGRVTPTSGATPAPGSTARHSTGTRIAAGATASASSHSSTRSAPAAGRDAYGSLTTLHGISHTVTRSASQYACR